MRITTSSQAGFREAAHYLLVMRLAIVGAELVLLLITDHLGLLGSDITEAALTSLGTMLLALGMTYWLRRRPPSRPWPVTLSLLLDLLLLGVWLSFTGGYTNPLTALLLLPLAMAIILLPMVHSILLAVGGITIYGLLMRWYVPVIPHAGKAHLEQLHLHGMWVAFMITAGILLWVGGALVRRLRAQQEVLGQFRERQLRDEQIIALGLSAATVAHRIGTPLNTMALLLNEMRSRPMSTEQSEDFDTLEEQLGVCSQQLRQLSEAASLVSASRLEPVRLADWLQRLRESATLLWPAADIVWETPETDAGVAVDATLDQAVLNIVGNALRASPDHVRIYCGREARCITLSIEDHGAGLTEWGSQHPGERHSESESGLGIGLFLSNATLQRLGGELRATVDESGTTMIIVLPEADHAL
ncbi:sensor histidine kinase [Mangrovitalea sediminis]|uniref:sensor histidine kinase n=1 Tax=Mangrovitalea sediminis TaxID=1982043 RepID=UPI000BE56DD6|nr:HAMP domain-containing sensor histidine kinase [Mangrovitalea sediminis]